MTTASDVCCRTTTRCGSSPLTKTPLFPHIEDCPPDDDSEQRLPWDDESLARKEAGGNIPAAAGTGAGPAGSGTGMGAAASKTGTDAACKLGDCFFWHLGMGAMASGSVWVVLVSFCSM